MRSSFDMMEDLLTCATPEGMHRIGSDCVQQIGFDAWVYAAMPSGGSEVPYLAGSLPPTWYAPYFRGGQAANDPVLAHCRQHAAPLLWNADHADDAERCPVFFREAADFGLRRGITVPIHGLGCQWGLLAVASTTAASIAVDARQRGEVHTLAAYLHEAGHRLASAAIAGDQVHLTERELECLRWTAEGKTGWEISRVLGISERTVVFHLENAARKFGVFGRRQAAARAIALQMITL
jgi:DNA-binding CsgD family transcriptional regulator